MVRCSTPGLTQLTSQLNSIARGSHRRRGRSKEEEERRRERGHHLQHPNMSTAQDLWCVRQDISQHKLDTAFLRYSIPQIQPKSGRNGVLPGCGDQNRPLWREDTRRDGVGSTIQNTEVTREGNITFKFNSFPTFLYLSLFVLLPPMTGHCLFNTDFMKYKLHSLFFLSNRCSSWQY